MLGVYFNEARTSVSTDTHVCIHGHPALPQLNACREAPKSRYVAKSETWVPGPTWEVTALKALPLDRPRQDNYYSGSNGAR